MKKKGHESLMECLMNSHSQFGIPANLLNPLQSDFPKDHIVPLCFQENKPSVDPKLLLMTDLRLKR